MKEKFKKDVAEEVESARSKHPPIQSIHEGYAILLEEVDEFWAEVKKKTKERDPKKMYKELVQVGAMAQRIVEDVVAKQL
jgi:hypothetical protein